MAILVLYLAAMTSSNAAARFEALVKHFADDPDVTPPEPASATTGRRAFGSNGLKLKGKIFAMLSRDQLVVKLPRERVDGLIAEGQGERMVSGGAREMKEWLVVATDASLDWPSLAGEARAFVARG
jgi:hypothetical protein